jgi:hypothetical protein
MLVLKPISKKLRGRKIREERNGRMDEKGKRVN